MEVKSLMVGSYGTNCYILYDENTKDALIIDPGEEDIRIIKTLEKTGATLKGILLTHGHIDHVGAVNAIYKKYNVPVFINELELEIMKQDNYIFGNINIDDENIVKIKQGSKITFNDNIIICVETPGHTPGGMTFLVDDYAFTGDTLFFGSVGRTDFNGGNMNVLIRSIKENLMGLQDETKVCSGHGPQSTIGYEKANNPYL